MSKKPKCSSGCGGGVGKQRVVKVEDNTNAVGLDSALHDQVDYSACNNPTNPLVAYRWNKNAKPGAFATSS